MLTDVAFMLLTKDASLLCDILSAGLEHGVLTHLPMSHELGHILSTGLDIASCSGIFYH